MHEGGAISHPTAPLGYLLRQGLCGLGWMVACVLGAWLGLRWRDRHIPQDGGKGASPPAAREIAHG
jgi:hypothetical protein